MKTDTLNAAQLKAATHLSGPAIVLAGPGSGKTKVIVERLRFLIEDAKVPPSDILVITFTKAAATEMQYRFLKITDSSYPEVVFGTFHSVFYQIIRYSKSKSEQQIQIATEKFKFEIIKDALCNLRSQKIIDDSTFDDAIQEIPDIISEISRLKNMDLSPSDCIQSISVRDNFGYIYDFYNKRLMEFGLIDFDDMIVRCYNLLSSNEVLLRQWQDRFKFVLIDEYQDINPMQYKVVRLLFQKSCNIFAVGDDDQSIYGFRGSDPRIMLEFQKSFEGFEPTLINLNVNYRCGSQILDNALKVIESNTVRYKKNLYAFEKNGSGAVVARRYESRNTQNVNIANFLLNHMYNLSDIAILYRTNSEGMNLQKYLKSKGIPTTLDDYSKSIFEDKAVKLCLSYMSFAYNGKKRSDFFKIINCPTRYISREAACHETVCERDVLNYYSNNPQRIKAVKDFFRSINMIAHLRPKLAVRYIRRTVGIDDMFEYSGDALDELEKRAEEFTDSKRFLTQMFKESEEIKENKSNKKVCKGGQRVNIMTMHGSKGLEFGTVWIPDLNEGIIPTRSAVTQAQIEEERRMLYVAMTRAKQALIMSYITGNEENKMLPTRFLKPVKELWEKNYGKKDQTSSEPSSGSSTSSSNSASSR